MSLEGYLDDQYNQDLQDVAEIEQVCPPNRDVTVCAI